MLDSDKHMSVPKRQTTTLHSERPAVTPSPRVRHSHSADIATPPTTHSAPRRAERPHWSNAYLTRLVATDVTVASLAVGLAVWLGPAAEAKSSYALMSVAAPIAWPLTILFAQGYQRRYLGVSVQEYRAVSRGIIGLLGAIAVGAVVANVSFSRGYLVYLLPALFLGSLVARRVLRSWLARQRRASSMMQRTVVVGRADAVADLITSLTKHPQHGLLPVAVCTSGLDTSWDAVSDVEGVPVMGDPSEAVAAVDLFHADAVVVASHPELAGRALRRLAWALEDRNVDLLVSTGLLDVAGPRLSVRPAEDTSLLHIERPAASRVHVVCKNVMDRSIALALVSVLAPVLITVALAIRFTSRGPVLFRQQRIGAKGEPFTIYKFRTMVDGADRQLDSLLHLSEGNDVLFKMRQDPRVTKVGSVLRRYSLDELPQLFNVVLGDMSLVGPRPPTPREVEQYEPDTMRRLHVRPGMTGLWQVSGRSDLDWEQSRRLDLRYVDNWSPLVDLQLLMRTVRAVVKGSGAY